MRAIQETGAIKKLKATASIISGAVDYPVVAADETLLSKEITVPGIPTGAANRSKLLGLQTWFESGIYGDDCTVSAGTGTITEVANSWDLDTGYKIEIQWVKPIINVLQT